MELILLKLLLSWLLGCKIEWKLVTPYAQKYIAYWSLKNDNKNDRKGPWYGYIV